MSKFERVSLENEIVFHLHDHEVLLSFFDDEGARAFREWWDDEGSEMFASWCAQTAGRHYCELLE